MRKTAGLLAAALAFAVTAAAHAKDDVGDLLNGLNGESDVTIRIGLIERLGATKSERAAEALGRTARRDADPRIRAAAAKALASFRDAAAFPSLKELLVAGGTREVRRQAALGMSSMPDGLAWTVRRIAWHDTTAVERLLLVSSLGDFPSLDAAGALERLTADDDAAVRCAALRALARHASGRAELGRVALSMLAACGDAETKLAVLDACDGVCDQEIAAGVPALEKDPDPRVADAASWIARRVEAAAAIERRRQQAADNAKRAKDGYAPVELPPAPDGPVPRRAKADVVLVYDATGSMGAGHVKRLPADSLDAASRDEARRETSFRHAWVAMQDTRREAWDPSSEYFPPVFDSAPRRDAKWRLTAIGVDTEGVEAGRVLREVLDRFEWRAGASRRIVVVCDNSLGDPDVAVSTAAAHRPDGFELDIGLVVRMSERHRAGWAALARAAGTDLPDRKK